MKQNVQGTFQEYLQPSKSVFFFESFRGASTLWAHYQGFALNPPDPSPNNSFYIIRTDTDMCVTNDHGLVLFYQERTN